ncbi:hypothetical protein RM863_01690 [Streptomyces sp. DSM 41014]|uniref:Hydrophobic W protein n=1 Tax=Streptomyces hintoniae TaxID=3075521 RepID=A0ABU2UC82_9ACTN|nr:hypothetical protein [Streptomyces sp. DSM 41014]MDT0470853.1 hypothetical protein [Streptomyces sp. DSM 41014]
MSNGPNREPSARIPVVIAEDGSAVVDGEPVPVVGGESVDVAILDTLHGYARSRNEAVTASITDPVAGSVAIVEVAPDGSSRLVEQRQEGPAAAVAPTPPPQAVAPAPPQAVALDKPPAPAAPPPGAPAPAAPAPQPPAPAAAQVPPPAQQRQPAPTPAPQPANTPARAPAPVRGIGQSDDEYEAPSLIKRPAVIGAVAVGVALLVIVPLVALGSGGSDGGASDKTAAAADSKRKTPTLLPTQPTVSATPSGWPHATPGVSASPSASASDSASPSPSASPSEEKRKEETEETKSAEAPVAAVPKPVKPPKPHKETAAEAVSKLAARSPGRHICYRVYFDKDGWQKPVCDGATAGRVNTKQKIKSINTATAGTKGTASNAWVRHDKWKTPWSGGVDGVDVYIGKTKKDYPYILGFVINVADGAVCQNAAVAGRWGGLACDQPTGQAPGNFIWGGTQDDARWLQAVRFTV